MRFDEDVWSSSHKRIPPDIEWLFHNYPLHDLVAWRGRQRALVVIEPSDVTENNGRVSIKFRSGRARVHIEADLVEEFNSLSSDQQTLNACLPGK